MTLSYRSKPLLLCLWGILSSGAVACAVDDGILGRLHGAGGSGGDRETAGAGNGNCGLTSPAVTVPSNGVGTGYSTCTGRIAASTFINALCVCEEVEIGDYLRTRGFDSSQGAYVTGQTDDGGAAVGINGAYTTLAGYTDVGGSLSIAGSGDVRFIGSLITRGDFRAAGNVTVAGSATIARNAWFAGAYVGLGPLSVQGELHHAQHVGAIPVSASSDFLEPVSITPACPCGSDEVLDIAGLIGSVRQHNDNAAWGIGVDDLASVADEAELTLPCGRFYLSRIAGIGRVTIHVEGMTALFIDGSIALDGALDIEVAPGAELDVFVGGNLATRSALTLSPEDRPAATRLFVAGSEDIALPSPLLGNLYAPHARVIAAGALEVRGSVFSRAFVGAAFASFVYDRAVYQAGRACVRAELPNATCTRCGTCTGGMACVDGACGSCRTDADCCGQTVCANGACAPLLGLLQ